MDAPVPADVVPRPRRKDATCRESPPAALAARRRTAADGPGRRVGEDQRRRRNRRPEPDDVRRRQLPGAEPQEDALLHRVERDRPARRARQGRRASSPPPAPPASRCSCTSRPTTSTPRRAERCRASTSTSAKVGALITTLPRHGRQGLGRLERGQPQVAADVQEPQARRAVLQGRSAGFSARTARSSRSTSSTSGRREVHRAAGFKAAGSARQEARKIVGIHNYSEVNRRISREGTPDRYPGTARIIKAVRKRNKKAKFWYTETGGLAKLRQRVPVRRRSAPGQPHEVHVRRSSRSTTSTSSACTRYNWTSATDCDVRVRRRPRRGERHAARRRTTRSRAQPEELPAR